MRYQPLRMPSSRTILAGTLTIAAVAAVASVTWSSRAAASQSTKSLKGTWTFTFTVPGVEESTTATFLDTNGEGANDTTANPLILGWATFPSDYYTSPSTAPSTTFQDGHGSWGVTINGDVVFVTIHSLGNSRVGRIHGQLSHTSGLLFQGLVGNETWATAADMLAGKPPVLTLAAQVTARKIM